MKIFWFKSFVKEELRKIARAFALRDKEIFKSKADIKELRKEIKLLHKQLHQLLHTTARTTAPITARSSLGPVQKRVLKRLDSIKLMKAIQSCITQGYSTSAIRDEIVNRFDIGERCFYNYLKQVRKQLHITASAVIKNK